MGVENKGTIALAAIPTVVRALGCAMRRDALEREIRESESESEREREREREEREKGGVEFY